MENPIKETLDDPLLDRSILRGICDLVLSFNTNTRYYQAASILALQFYFHGGNVHASYGNLVSKAWHSLVGG